MGEEIIVEGNSHKKQTPQAKIKPTVPNVLSKEVNTVIRNAALSSSVLLFVALSSIILYYNFISIAPYISSIIWGILISIPLHYVKRELLVILVDSSSDFMQVTSGTLRALVWSFIKHGFKLCFTPFIDIFKRYCPTSLQNLLNKYFTLASAAGKVPGHSAKIRVSKFYSHFSTLPSSPYFGILFLLTSWWLIFKICLNVPILMWVILVLFLILLFTLKTFRKTIGVIWRSIRTKLFGLDSSIAASQENCKDTEKRLHSSLAYLLVFGSTFFFYLLLFLTLFQTVYHTRSMVRSSYSSLIFGEQFASIRHALSEYPISIATWADSQIQGKFPGCEFSVSEITNMINRSYDEGTTSNAVETLLIYVSDACKKYNLPITALFLESKFLKLNSTISYSDLFKEWKTAAQDLWRLISTNTDTEHLKENAIKVFKIVSSVGSRIISTLVSGAGILSHLAVIASVSHTLVSRESSILEDIGYILGSSIDPEGIFQASMETALVAIFAKMAKTLIWHSTFTWLSFEVLGIPFSLLAGLLSGIISVLPIASSFSMLILPFGIGFLGIAERSILKIVLLVAIHYFYADYADQFIYKDSLLISSTTATNVLPSESITGTSIALGVIAFGAKGVVFGPLLACSPKIILEMYKSMLMIGKKEL